MEIGFHGQIGVFATVNHLVTIPEDENALCQSILGVKPSVLTKGMESKLSGVALVSNNFYYIVVG